MSNWGRYQSDLERGPTSAFGVVVKVVLVLASLIFVTAVVGIPLGWFRDAAAVAQEQFGARALLTKYEWFKDAAAQLDKKQADIKVYDVRLQGLADAYKDVKRQDWPRDDREQYSIWSSEAAGVRASYNSLAADYNAEMAKFNYRFANVGDLPQGASGGPLPRAYRAYTEQ